MKIQLVRKAAPWKNHISASIPGFTERLKQLRIGDALVVVWDKERHPFLNTSARTLAKRQGIKVSAIQQGDKLQIRRIK